MNESDARMFEEIEQLFPRRYSNDNARWLIDMVKKLDDKVGKLEAEVGMKASLVSELVGLLKELIAASNKHRHDRLWKQAHESVAKAEGRWVRRDTTKCRRCLVLSGVNKDGVCRECFEHPLEDAEAIRSAFEL